MLLKFYSAVFDWFCKTFSILAHLDCNHPGREAKRRHTGARISITTIPVAKRSADTRGRASRLQPSRSRSETQIHGGSTHLDCNHPGREAKRKYTGHAPRLQPSRSRSETQIHRAARCLSQVFVLGSLRAHSVPTVNRLTHFRCRVNRKDGTKSYFFITNLKNKFEVS
jgi:hypothetical protein